MGQLGRIECADFFYIPHLVLDSDYKCMHVCMYRYVVCSSVEAAHPVKIIAAPPKHLLGSFVQKVDEIT